MPVKHNFSETLVRYHPYTDKPKNYSSIEVNSHHTYISLTKIIGNTGKKFIKIFRITKMDNQEANDISLKWAQQNPHIKQMSQFFPINQFHIERGQRQLACQFKVVKFMTETQHHVEKLYKNPQQFGFNRNSHIMTFEHTRVKLGNDQLSDAIQNYINANYVTIQGKRLIASQGPMHSTFHNFWRMVQENKVEQIFMLCLRVQKTKLKCDPYWLYEENKQSPVKHYEVSVVQKTSQNNIEIKQIQWKNIQTNVSGSLKHYQLHGWPDGDKPTQNIKLDVIKLIKINIEALSNNKIPIVHCSAGVGRTGTFIAMTQLYMQIQQKKNISIFETVRKIREQRWGLVYTQPQYEYLYDFVQDLVDQIENIESDDSL